MHPVFNYLVSHGCNALCYLAFVVGEDKVHAAAVYVELFAEVLASHSGALAVPSGEAIAPGRGPAHDVLGLCALPEGKVGGVALFALSVELAGGVEHVVEVAARKDTVVVCLVVFCNIEVYRAFAYVCEAVVDNLLHELNLLDDVSRRVGLDAGGQHVERLHCLVVAQCVVLYHFHGLELLEACLLCYLVLAFVCVVLKMTYVGDVPYIAHFVAEVGEVAEKHVECDCGARVSQMGIAVYGGAANVEAYVGCVQGNELFFLTRQRIVYHEFVFHNAMWFLCLFSICCC